jgi:hypothetical protein
MAFSNDTSSGMVMPVSPMYGGGYGGGFGGFGGDNAWWVIILLLCGWGNGGFGGGFGGWGGNMMLGYDFPWLLNGQNGINNNVNDGFRTSQLQDSVTSVRDGVSNLATQLCDCCGNMQMSMANGFAGVNQNVSQGFANTNLGMCQGFNGVTNAVTGAQNAISQQLYSNELASLNRSFAEQTANTQGFNSVQSQLAQNGYNQAAGTADLKYTIATEACADRANSTQNTQSILNLVNSGIQSIKDQLCQDKIDAKNDEIAQLRQEILYTRGQAAAESIYQRGQNSQDVQTAQILAGQAAIPGQVYTRLNECPVSTVPVYGRQPIFTCNNGCGCSGATAF